MADRLDLIVGDFVWRKTTFLNHEVGMLQMRIKRVGRVFFYVHADHAESKYRIDTLEEVKSHGHKHICYLTMDALIAERDRIGLFETLGKVFSPYVGRKHTLSLDQLQRILTIVREGKD